MEDGDVAAAPAAAPAAASGPMSVEDAVQEVLKQALIKNSLARGLREAVKALDRRTALLCVLAENCNEAAYTKLIEALCNEHGINLIKIPDNKQLGEWAGLCKIDKEGNARKVVACSCAVVRDYGDAGEAVNVLEEYFKSR